MNRRLSTIGGPTGWETNLLIYHLDLDSKMRPPRGVNLPWGPRLETQIRDQLHACRTVKRRVAAHRQQPEREEMSSSAGP